LLHNPYMIIFNKPRGRTSLVPHKKHDAERITILSSPNICLNLGPSISYLLYIAGMYSIIFVLIKNEFLMLSQAVQSSAMSSICSDSTCYFQ
jgi:hypothetical protein